MSAVIVSLREELSRDNFLQMVSQAIADAKSNGELGPWLASLRKANGLTQEQLAGRIGCHWVTISKLERQKMDLTIEWVAKVVGACSNSPKSAELGDVEGFGG